MRQHTDIDERDVAFAPFDPAQIRAGEAAFESKSLLRPVAPLAKFNEALSEQRKGIVIHRGFVMKEPLAYGFDRFRDTLYDYPLYE